MKDKLPMTTFKPIKPYVDDSNPSVKWYPYNVQFQSADGTFQVELQAVSFEHAWHLFDDLKKTGKVVSQTVAIEV
jgi:hypothetical protein